MNEEKFVTHGGLPTDVIISHYESIINKGIATKALAFAKNGTLPTYTKEEMAYLTKKAVDENPLAEVQVVTPSPTIVLKKGRTEINVKNAAVLLQKMEERHPSSKSPPLSCPTFQESISHMVKNPKQDEDGDEDSLTLDDLCEAVTESEVVEEKPFGEVEPTAKEMFKRRVNFPAHKVSQEVASKVAPDESKFNPMNTDLTPTKTVNKNAYEIRADILSQALAWVQYKRTFNPVNDPTMPTENDVIDVANKFYRFVENRR